MDVFQILDEVLTYYYKSINELTGKSRHKSNCEARHMFVYLTRKYTRISYERIGEIINRDHSTCISAFEKIEDLVDIQDRQTLIDISLFRLRFIDIKEGKINDPFHGRIQTQIEAASSERKHRDLLRQSITNTKQTAKCSNADIRTLPKTNDGQRGR